MAHRAAWLCADCKHQLGEIVCGALKLWASGVIMVGPDSLAVTCPRCSSINVWSYRVQTVAS